MDSGHCPEQARYRTPWVAVPAALAKADSQACLALIRNVERDRKAGNAHFRHSETPFDIGIGYLMANSSALTEVPPRKGETHMLKTKRMRKKDRKPCREKEAPISEASGDGIRRRKSIDGKVAVGR